jgi:hypothetical protein
VADAELILEKSTSPYRLRDQFLSPSEISIFRALQEMVEDRYLICPKVALSDIFTIIRPNENVHFYNKIFRKHVDFLLCDPKTLKPAIAVEIIKSTPRETPRVSEQFIDDLFLSEGIPLVHLLLGEKYDVPALVNLFKIALMKTKDASQSSNNGKSSLGDSVPMCPSCGKMMVLRIYRDGPQAGKKYYGCMDSPACRGTVSIDK